jgi:hypothetical protein
MCWNDLLSLACAPVIHSYIPQNLYGKSLCILGRNTRSTFIPTTLWGTASSAVCPFSGNRPTSPVFKYLWNCLIHGVLLKYLLKLFNTAFAGVIILDCDNHVVEPCLTWGSSFFTCGVFLYLKIDIGTAPSKVARFQSSPRT